MAARSTTYAHLLAPGTIGTMTVPNRIVLPAMDQNSCSDDGLITDLNIAHYEARARGGTGLLVLETAAVAYPVGATSRHQPSLGDDRCIPGLARLAEAVHRHGAKMAVQINHHGKTAGVDAAEDREQLVPSVPLPPDDVSIDHLTMDELIKLGTATGGKRPVRRAATADDLAWVVEQFAVAAERVKRAGLDAVEIQTGHGYLISTFLSPKYNQRTDEYGGSLEHRARLMCEVIRAVRERCGDFPIIVRLDALEYGGGGITPADSVEHARLAEAAGADAINVSAMSPNALGPGFTDGPLPWSPGQYVEYTRAIKAAVRIPVMGVGRIMPDQAEALIAEGAMDYVCMGRQLLADPDLGNRLAAGRPDLVRTCINCYVCVAANFFDAVPECAINAELGHYDRPDPAPASPTRHVVVVGGGPAGMEAARVAASRGHRVTLLEKAERLGGTAHFSSLTTPMNGELVRYLSAAIAEEGVEVRLGAAATVDAIVALAPDAVVVATGARRSRPDVPGGDLPHVLSGDDLRGLLTGDDPKAGKRLGMADRLVVAAGRKLGITDDMDRVRTMSKRWMPLGDDVVVVGGGLVGVELAEFLAERGRNVTVLEAADKVGVEMAHPRRARAVRDARTHGVRFETGAELVAIDEREVTFRQGEATRTVRAEQVILASGVHADTSLADALAERGIEVHVAGDAGAVGYIQGAIATGHAIGRSV
jgi:2,4-dienoyl-CoA reductase-like NADH-dependent reductase (Old Yellow Enzyme family)/thioredoxin reductase